ncbi:hypothetical protein D3C80_1300410 [compost metagenome]
MPPNPDKVDPVGNCAYPKISPCEVPILVMTHIFKYLLGSHCVDGLSNVSISLSVQFVCGLTILLIPVEGSPSGVLCAKQNCISVSAPTALVLKPGVPAVLLKSWLRTVI